LVSSVRVLEVLAIASSVRTIVYEGGLVPFVQQYPASPPADYPVDLEQKLCLASGEVLWVRPVVPADAETLAAEFAATDEGTLYARFFTASFDLTDDRLRYLTELDYTTHLALAVTTVGGDKSTGVAIGRYVARTPTDVEGAIVVKPEYRRLGIARILVERLTAAAARAGHSTMSASYLADNAAAASLLERLGFGGGTLEDGVVVEASRRLVSDPAAIGSV
jgi:GNAT superfamily N-acetyltransferase